MANVIEQALALLEDVTPLHTDCGQVCDGRCCQPSADSIGMLLLPGEEKLLVGEDFTITAADGGMLLTCDGHCRREMRPFACRIFPLFPYVGEDGRVRAVYDPRSYRLCPLTQNCANVPLRRDFVRAVRRAGRLLMRDPACAAFLRANSREIDELSRLLPLDDERPPIARRKLR
jgi:hypothetical protein